MYSLEKTYILVLISFSLKVFSTAYWIYFYIICQENWQWHETCFVFNVKLVLFQLIFVSKQLALAGWAYGWSFRLQQRKPTIYIGYDRESVIVIDYQRPLLSYYYPLLASSCGLYHTRSVIFLIHEAAPVCV